MFLWTNKKNINTFRLRKYLFWSHALMFFLLFFLFVFFLFFISTGCNLEDDFDEGLNTIFLLLFLCVGVFVFAFLIYFIQ